MINLSIALECDFCQDLEKSPLSPLALSGQKFLESDLKKELFISFPQEWQLFGQKIACPRCAQVEISKNLLNGVG